MSASKATKAKSLKTPKVDPNFVSNRTPRYEVDPESNSLKKACWHLGLLDFNCEWGFNKIQEIELLYEILSKLKNFETMTWQEIFDASGGRKHGNNSHGIPIKSLTAAARKRLKELKLDDYESLFSLRLTGTQRIWGILDGCILKILWFDSKHKVYPLDK